MIFGVMTAQGLKKLMSDNKYTMVVMFSLEHLNSLAF